MLETLSCLSYKRRVERIVEERGPLQRCCIIRADTPQSTAEQIEPGSCRLQFDVRHGVGLIHYAADTCQDRIAQRMPLQHRIEGTVTTMVRKARTWDVERLGIRWEVGAAFWNEQKLGIGINAPSDKPGAGHSIHPHLAPVSPSHSTALLCWPPLSPSLAPRAV